MNRQIPWPRVLVEGVVIVSSILLAFGIEAWWDNRGEAVEEERVLTAILGELETNRTRLTQSTAWHLDIREVTDALLALSAAGVTEITSDSLDHLLAQAIWWETTATFEMAALDALILGGTLSSIQNEALRRRLTAWQRRVDDLSQMATQDYDHFSEVFAPYLREHADLVQIQNATTHIPGSNEPAYSKEVPLSGHTDHRPLLRDREFRNLLLQKRWVQDDILESYTSLGPMLEELMDIVESELSRGPP